MQCMYSLISFLAIDANLELWEAQAAGVAAAAAAPAVAVGHHR